MPQRMPTNAAEVTNDRSRSNAGCGRRNVRNSKPHAPRQDQLSALTLPDVSWKQRFRRRLLNWYRRHGRDLPWRDSPDAYRVWVSEIMLQQTQVATVKPYFERFLATFPTVDALAASDEEQVLRLWEGLGYYRRARQMHKAARIIVDEHDGVFPSQPESVRSLPGIGRYTAGAILSIAFDARQPIVEANTLRLYSRLLAMRDDPRSGRGNEFLWKAAADWLPRRGAGQFNQALMDLGAEVCLVRKPRCEVCPVATLCRAREQGIQEQMPRKAQQPKIEDVREAAVVVRNKNRVLLRRCGDGERFAGLWDFVRFPLANRSRPAAKRLLANRVEQLVDLAIEDLTHLATIKHAVTRFRITLDCYEAQLGQDQAHTKRRAAEANRSTKQPAPFRWVEAETLHDVPLSVTGRKIADLLVGTTT